MNKRRLGLTLIELLVALAIVAILAAFAVPHFLEAQTRSKVSAAKANLRTIDGALNTYYIDHNHFPPAQSALPDDPFGILADHQLSRLTSPISYTSTEAFRDPFGDIQANALVMLSSNTARDSGFPFPTLPNPGKSLLYFYYPAFARMTHNPRLNYIGLSVVSLGPDRRDSFGAFAPFPYEVLPPLAPGAGIFQPVDSLYDPTNGTLSLGDIPRFSGQVPPIQLP